MNWKQRSSEFLSGTWNQDCQYCRVMCQLPDDDQAREMLSCKFMVMQGMKVTELSDDLKSCLRGVLKR